MRILHLMLANFYAEGFGYQENLLPKQNATDGHEVAIIASTSQPSKGGRLIHVKPSRYINQDGIEVTRIPYSWVLPRPVMAKIRAYQGLYARIQEFRPDVILHHGVASLSLRVLRAYKKKNADVRIYADSHMTFSNSARGFLSREMLHKRFYGPVLRQTLPYLEKVLCVTPETMRFLESLYAVPRNQMELYPLGGVILGERERLSLRSRVREGLGLRSGDILIVHSGKMSHEKRTAELVKAFLAAQNSKLRLVLVGSFAEDVGADVLPLLETDSRACFVGWASPHELQGYLCAADLYVQPGSQSVTMQQALCCGSAVLLYPHRNHIELLGNNALYARTSDDITNVLLRISRDPRILQRKREQGFEIAQKMLDYRVLASRLYL